jgi:branched-subunit amino acid aminotransferase/4-amino-4-deoxychorismate lyase
MRSRLHWWIAEQEVKRTDPDMLAVLVEENGQVTETYLANVLLVRNERIVSPPLDQILEGISLRFVQELCGGIGMSFEEKSFTVSEIFGADEILLTSTPFGVCGVSEFDGLPQQFPGKVVMALREAWSQVVGRDIWADFASPLASRSEKVSE